jgi:hypothetical protein
MAAHQSQRARFSFSSDPACTSSENLGHFFPSISKSKGMDAHHAWPTSIKSLSWPRDGIMYSYEHRGYIIPAKLEHWLNQAFGVGKAKYVVRSNFLFETYSTCSCFVVTPPPFAASQEPKNLIWSVLVTGFSCSTSASTSRHRENPLRLVSIFPLLKTVVAGKVDYL